MGSWGGLIAGVGARAHEENLITLQKERDARTNVINMALKSIESMPEDRQGPIMQELVTFTSDPKYKSEKFAKKLGEFWTMPVERTTSTSGIQGEQPMPQLPLGGSVGTSGMQGPPPSGLRGQAIQPPPPPQGWAPGVSPVEAGPTPPPPPPIQANPPMAQAAAQPIPAPPDMAIGKVITGTERMSPQAARRRENLEAAEAGETSRYRAQSKARAEEKKAERDERRKEGLDLGLKGQDLANYINDLTIRDRATGTTLQLVTGMLDGKPGYAWKDPSGLLREYTTTGPGVPLEPGRFTPKESADSVAQQEMDDWLKKNPGKGASDYKRWVAGLAPSIRIGIERESRRGTELDKLPPQIQNRVRSTAKRVAQGLPVGEGILLLGGLKSGLGMALEEAVSEMNAAIIPQAVRAQLVSTEDSLRIIDRVSQMVDEIDKNPDSKAKAAQSKILEDFIEQQAPLMARAVGHVGVLTQRDVDSVKQILPGWKSANFAPGFAREKIRLLRDRFVEHRGVLTNEQQRIFPQDGSTPPPAAFETVDDEIMAAVRAAKKEK